MSVNECVALYSAFYKSQDNERNIQQERHSTQLLVRKLYMLRLYTHTRCVLLLVHYCNCWLVVYIYYSYTHRHDICYYTEVLGFSAPLTLSIFI